MFNDEFYGENTHFFPESAGIREARFILWLLERYGAKDLASDEAEKIYLVEILRTKGSR